MALFHALQRPVSQHWTRTFERAWIRRITTMLIKKFIREFYKIQFSFWFSVLCECLNPLMQLGIERSIFLQIYLCKNAHNFWTFCSIWVLFFFIWKTISMAIFPLKKIFYGWLHPLEYNSRCHEGIHVCMQRMSVMHAFNTAEDTVS
jgi:hypothetical protein